jgi:hypothetical protein
MSGINPTKIQDFLSIKLAKQALRFSYSLSKVINQTPDPCLVFLFQAESKIVD